MAYMLQPTSISLSYAYLVSMLIGPIWHTAVLTLYRYRHAYHIASIVYLEHLVCLY